MTCYHPLKGFPIGFTKNGKINYKITGYDASGVLIEGDKVDVLPAFFDGQLYYRRTGGLSGRIVRDFVPIPCGQCVGCRLKRSKDWATRCMLEYKSHDSSYFLTLTYDDVNLPYNSFVHPETGEVGYKSTLVRRDIQLFIKRLRDNYSRKYNNLLKYYACGEYGTKTARPHYHLIVFGLKLDDLQFFKRSSSGYNLYNSPWLDRIWKKGYCVVGDVTFESCAYVSRYIMKKQTGDSSSVYDDYNFEPEFNLMSTKPAIGLEFFEDNFQDIYKNDEIILPEGRVVTPPRYFDKKMDLIDEELMDGIKDRRKDVAEQIKAWKESRTTQSYQELLRSEEIAKKGSIKRLVRPLE